MEKAPFENLANAIVLKAVEDYRKTDDRRARRSIEAFFRSSWYQLLTNVDGEQLIQILRKETQHDR